MLSVFQVVLLVAGLYLTIGGLRSIFSEKFVVRGNTKFWKNEPEKLAKENSKEVLFRTRFIWEVKNLLMGIMFLIAFVALFY